MLLSHIKVKGIRCGSSLFDASATTGQSNIFLKSLFSMSFSLKSSLSIFKSAFKFNLKVLKSELILA